MSFDIGPPGFSRDHARVIAMWGMMAILIFPLGVTGLFVAAQSDDWEVGIRAATVIFGAIGVIAAVGPIFWVFSHAWLRRERVQISPSGLLIRVGHPFLSRAHRATDLGTVSFDGNTHPPKKRLLAVGPFIRVTWGDRRILVATGLAGEDHTRLVIEMKQALVTAKNATASGPVVEWRFSLKTTVLAVLGGLSALVLGPIRHPSPYVVCDLLTIGALFTLPAVASDLDLFSYYPFLFGAFLVGVWIRRFDGQYLRGLSQYCNRHSWFPGLFLCSGFFVGLAGGVSLLPRLHWIAALSIPVVLSVWVHAHVLGRGPKAREGDDSSQHFPIEVLSSMTLIPMAIVHEHASFLFFEDTSRRLFILALPMVLPVVVFVYLPIRLHYFIDNPGDRSNAVWFGLTVTAISIYAVFGVSPL